MHTLWSPVLPLQKHTTASPEDSLPVFHPRWQQCYRQNTCVFTCTHYCSSPSAVAGITRGTICHAGRRLVCRHLESSNVWHSDAMVQESHGSKDSTTQSTTSLLKQLCFNAAFRKQRSLLSGCYPQQCVLRLVEEIRDWGRSQYIFCSSKIMSTEELPWKLQEGFYAPQWQLYSTAIVQNTGYSGLSHTCSLPSNCLNMWKADQQNHSTKWEPSLVCVKWLLLLLLFSHSSGGIEIVGTPPYCNWCYLLNWASIFFLTIITIRSPFWKQIEIQMQEDGIAVGFYACI